MLEVDPGEKNGERSGGRGARRDAALRACWWILPLLVGAALHGFLFADYLPMSEFRDWMRAEPLDASTWLRSIVLRDDAFTRTFSLWSAAALGDLTAGSRVALDLSLIALGLACGPALFALLRDLGLPRPVASGALLLWLLSWPVLDCLCWHATISDRLAIFFALVALVAYVRGARAPGTPARVVASNLVVCGALVLAYNSKESSWFLLPGLWFLALFGTPGARPGRIARLRGIALPTLYGLYYHVRGLIDWAQNPALHEHSMRGSMLENVLAYPSALTSLHERDALAFVSVFLGISMGLALFGLRRPPEHVFRGVAVLVVLFAGSAALTLFTSPSVPYRMFAPMAFFAPLLCLVTWLATTGLGGVRTSILRSSLYFALVLGIAGLFLVRALPPYLRLSRHNAQLLAALPVLRTQLGAAAPKDVVFLVPPTGIRFFEGSAPAVAEQLFGVREPARWQGQRVEARYRTDGAPILARGCYTIEFTAEGRLLTIWDGESLLWQR